jgi:AmmeMemoRadiSam system protein B
MNYKKTRKASVAGSFYPLNKLRLINEIKNCFINKHGPGKYPAISKKNNLLKGVIVPHAGISYSGAVAAHSYLAIAEDGFADSFIIIGPNHRGIGSGISLYPPGKWESPIGDTIMDEELISNLKGYFIDVNENSHPYGENSIEVQLPFINYISKKRKFTAALISMALQDFEIAKKLGERIAEVVKKEERRIILIASSDFSHEGFPYGRLPPKNLTADQFARKQDKLAIEKIKKFDANGLISTVYNNNISMCGYGPIATLLISTKKLGASKIELLKYITSNDIEPSNYCVGYGSFKIL